VLFQVIVSGTGFVAGSKAYWNGMPRETFVSSPTSLSLFPLAGDVQTIADLTTVQITVVNPAAAASNPLPLMIYSPRVLTVQAQAAAPGTAVTVSSAPTVATRHSVTATLTNNNPAGAPATVAVASYSANPAGGTVFAAGGFFDVQVTGADASDSLAARFYYPSNVTAAVEASLRLHYGTGAAWAPVVGSGGALPVKDTTDNLDGTVSGGRVTVTLDGSSTPRITELSGTVFALAEVSDTTAPTTTVRRSPDANARRWNNTDVTLTLAATDDASGVARTEVSINFGAWRPYDGPIRFSHEGHHVVGFRSVDAAGNVEKVNTTAVNIDKTPPVLIAFALPMVLSPANRKLVDVIALPLTFDLLSGFDRVTLESVESNDPDTTPDDMQGWSVGVADVQGRLRAEAARNGGSRTYELTYRSVDKAGNTAQSTATIVVPGTRR
jgi:hypothetical protein